MIKSCRRHTALTQGALFFLGAAFSIFLGNVSRISSGTTGCFVSSRKSSAIDATRTIDFDKTNAKNAFNEEIDDNNLPEVRESVGFEPNSSEQEKGLRPLYVFSNVREQRHKSYSQSGQDLVILKLFEENGRNGGSSGRYFVDLAANDAIRRSNTLHLEQNGWIGVCMEPNPIYWYGLAAHRKCLVLGAFLGGSKDGVEVDVSLSNGIFGGIVGDEFDNKDDTSKEEKRNLLTITSALKFANPPNIIDYLSLDVEGAEYIVMENFPFDDYKIRFATVERPNKALRELLAKKGYVHANLTLSTFGETLWYHPSYVNLSSSQIEEVIKEASPKPTFSFTWAGYPNK